MDHIWLKGGEQWRYLDTLGVPLVHAIDLMNWAGERNLCVQSAHGQRNIMGRLLCVNQIEEIEVCTAAGAQAIIEV